MNRTYRGSLISLLLFFAFTYAQASGPEQGLTSEVRAWFGQACESVGIRVPPRGTPGAGTWYETLLGDAIHTYKQQMGYGAAHNLTRDEIIDLVAANQRQFQRSADQAIVRNVVVTPETYNPKNHQGGKGSRRGGRFGRMGRWSVGAVFVLLPEAVNAATIATTRGYGWQDLGNTSLNVTIGALSFVPVVGTIVNTYMIADFAIGSVTQAIVDAYARITRDWNTAIDWSWEYAQAVSLDIINHEPGVYPWQSTYTRQNPLYLNPQNLAACFEAMTQNVQPYVASRIARNADGTVSQYDFPLYRQIPVGYVEYNRRMQARDQARVVAAIRADARNWLVSCLGDPSDTRRVFRLTNADGSPRPLGDRERAICIGTDPDCPPLAGPTRPPTPSPTPAPAATSSSSPVPISSITPTSAVSP